MHIDEILAKVKDVFAKKLHSHRRAWVTQWKAELASTLDPHSVKAFRYVKQADFPPLMFVQTASGKDAARVDEQDAALRDFWLPIFSPQDLPAEDILRAHAQRYCEGCPIAEWIPYSLDVNAMRSAVMKGKRHTSPGLDGWYIHELRALPDVALRQLGCFMMRCEELALIPDQWAQGWISMLPKETPVTPHGVHSADSASVARAPGKLRPITILPVTWRICMRARSKHVGEWIQPLLHPWQHGGRAGHSAQHCIGETYHIIERAMASPTEPVHGLVLDIMKCYDSIPLEFVEVALSEFGVPFQLACSWCSMWKAMTKRFKLAGNVLGNVFNITRGLPQGDPMSTVACNAVFSALCRRLEKVAEENSFVLHLSSYLDDIIVLVDHAWQLQCIDAVLHDFFDPMHVKINSSKTSVFSTCATLSKRWEKDGSPGGYHVTNRLTLLGTELALHGSAPFHGSTTEDKFHKTCKRLERAAILPIARHRRVTMVSTACLPVLSYSPVRPLPTKAASNKLCALVARAFAGSKKRGADSHEVRMSLFMPAHRCDWHGTMFLSLLDLVRVAISWSHVSVWQLWMDCLQSKRIKVSGPVTAFLALCHNMGICYHSDGTVSCGPLVVDVLNADFGSPAWKHDVRTLIRNNLLRLLSIRRATFDGVQNGINRKSTLRLHGSIHNMEAMSLERLFCGSLSVISRHGDLRPPDDDRCPYCGEDDLTLLHLIYLCPRFASLRSLNLDSVSHLASCFVHHGIVPEVEDSLRDLYPDDLVLSLHKQVVSIWTEKLFLDDCMRKSGNHQPRPTRR
eukprot:2230210-Amphidinium_carterae.1